MLDQYYKERVAIELRKIKLELSNPLYDLNHNRNYLFRDACNIGISGELLPEDLFILDPVKLCLMDPTIDPMDKKNDNYIIKMVCKKNFVSVLRLLMLDSRVDPDYKGQALLTAFKYCNLEVVKLLMSDIRVSGSKYKESYLEWSIRSYDALPLVKYMIETLKYNPTLNNNRLLKLALIYNKTDVVKYLDMYSKTLV